MAIILPVKNINPVWGKNCFIAPNATIVGDVSIGNDCSIWFNTVVRGDVNKITIGDKTNIQDGAIIHCTYQTASTTIGNRVSIGHAAIVHGCVLEDDSFVGMSATVMDHAVVQSKALVAAGAVILENTIVESGYIYAGIPAKKLMPLNDNHLAMLDRIANNYVKYASWFEK